MNNTVLRILSGLLALAAVAVGYLAVQSKNAPPPPVVAASAPTVQLVPVAVAARTIRAGQPLTAQDVAIKGLAAPPTTAYRQIQEATGRVTISDVPAGTPLTPSLFAADSLAYLLKPGERAIAIRMDEIAAVGGYIKPGDAVDVVSYVTDTAETRPSALTVLENARLLAVGDTSQLTQLEADAQARDPANRDATKDAPAVKPVSGNLATEADRRLKLQSAVIAVPEREVNRVMLAANAGQLRLALRPPVGADPNESLAANGKIKAITPPPVSVNQMAIAKDRAEKGDGRKYVMQDGSRESPVFVDKRVR